MKDGPRLADFEGLWRLTRRIDDHRAGHEAQFTGQARFSPDPTGLRYVETGALQIPGHAAFQAERTYLWSEKAGVLMVRFDDGRAFHDIDPGLTPSARHDCAPDVYQVLYDFSDWPVWRAVWAVKGPLKDYRMTSVYRR